MTDSGAAATTAEPAGALTTRIMGVETEYGIACTTADGGRMIPDELARLMFRPVVEKYASSNIFTSSAARLYLDVGSHPEWATAECRSITQLLNHERAGDVVVDGLAGRVEQELGEGARVYVFKNNVDSIGNSYGCHENYLVRRGLSLKKLGLALVPFLITRQLIAGAGKIYRPFPGSPSERYGTGFCVSQRADHVWEGVSSATTRSRPMINTRDEPHADSERFRRLHVIVGDSSMAEPTFALKIGSALLVLEMIEAGFPMPEVELANDAAAIRDIARDPRGRTVLPLTGEGTVTALELQDRYCSAAERWLDVRPPSRGGTPPEEFARIVDLWRRTVTALDTGDFSTVDTEIDWVIKRKLLNRYRERLGVDLGHPKLAQIDLAYHDVRPGRGLYSTLVNRGMIARWTTDEAIETAVHTPPHDTRAALRGRFLDHARALGAPVTVDWMRLRVNRPEPQVLQLGDPFTADDPRVDELISYMDAHATDYGTPS
ncbi:Pup--protein ligase [Corynebacterium pygosceleis]|uniref:Pup--protein ligase n=1 Tax=Corynebacterium pygosceleis TaxID=2800406 RepID=A0A9Q4GI43_9CORY|nr:Pup--protein ligase [Corynebacterium pygosceleis]MCK7637058.1 Pup--protein ligase [Corynebacterium pygosceleis]MCL0120170.1 Pup--protein ligase [Corynebacterium pygosceleis]MCX7443714.1 Pup--protein ligase [Corynebacterium pygosceleis]MCX7467811.1 Pup--protein ligase [Corynebacterium pygosceleis]